MNFWTELTSFASARSEHMLPIILLFIIFIVFLIACLWDCYRERNVLDISIPPRTPNVIVTDGKTGEEKIVPAQE